MRKITLLLFSIFVSIFTYGQVPSSGLQKSYLFTGSSLQNFQNPGVNNLTPVGSASTFVTNRKGAANSAINMGGDYFSAGPFDGGYQTITSDRAEFTINFWVKTSTNDTQARLLVSHGDNATRGYKAYMRNGIITFAGSYYSNGSNSGFVATSGSVVSDGQWHFVSLVSTRVPYAPNGSTIRYYIYIDGQYVSSNQNTQTSEAYNLLVTPASDPQRFGIDYNVAGDRYEDDIDDIRIYNRRLSNEEIIDVYLEGQPTSVSGSVVNATTLNMNWTAADTETLWDVTYVATGGDVNDGFTMEGVTKPYSLKAIAPNTTYDVYVRARVGVYYGSYSTPYTFTTGSQPVVYVNKNATGNNDGTSWTDALTDLAYGINGANSGIQVWVAQESYNPSVDEFGALATDIRARYFWSKDGVEVLGGFVGNETLESERDPVNQKATLEGYMNATDRVYNVLKIDADNTAKFDGFIVHGGAISGNGAGLYLTGDAAFFNMEFRNNYATSHGGAVFAIGSNSDFVNCRFEENVTGSYDGGALYLNNSTLHVYNSVLFNNTAARYGTAINCYESTIYLQNSTVVGNTGGANTIQLSQNSQISIQQCIFWGNNTTYGSSTGSGSIIFNNGIFEGTTPTGGSINTDPMFVDLANGDLHLTGCSPAVNAVVGTPTNPYNDIEGNNRIIGGVMDFGAYEAAAPNATSITVAESTLCDSEMQTLTAVGLTNISWNNSITNGVAFLPDADLTYTVTGDNSNNCSVSIDAVFTTYASPEIEILASETFVCGGNQVVLTASGADSYDWDNNVTNGSGFIPTQTETYTVIGTENTNNCETVESIVIEVLSITDETVQATDTEVCSGSSTTILTTSSENGAGYYLRDASDNIIDGPILGDGNALSFNTGNLNVQTEFNVMGSASLYTPATVASAVDIDGINDYVNLGTDNRGVTTKMSIETWVKTTSSTAKLFAAKYNGGNGMYMIMNESGKVAVQGRDGLGGSSGARTSGYSSSSINDGNWHYVVATVNSVTSKWRIYIDGVEESPTPDNTVRSTPSIASNSAFLIGKNPLAAAYMPLEVDKVVWWNIELSAATIASNASGCLDETEPGVVGYFNFDEGTGLIATDLSGNGDGTLANIDPVTGWVTGIGVTCLIKTCDIEMTQTATVNVNSVYNIAETKLVCSGGSYTFPDGTMQSNITSQVVYVSNLLTTNTSCDSIITTTVNINPEYNIAETKLVCSGGSYTFPDGTMQSNITSQVVYSSNLLTTNTSCDSVITTTVNVNPVYDIAETKFVCNGGSYTFPDGTMQSNITSQVVYVSDLLTTNTLCDSVITTTVNVNPEYNITETKFVCNGGSYTFPDGTMQSNITSQVVYASNLLTTNTSCDSVITTTVNVNPVYDIVETELICNGGSYTFPDGTTQSNITSQVVYVSNLATANNSCDSTITTTVDIELIDLSVSLSLETLTATQIADGYQWVDCNNGNAPISGANGQDFTPDVNGNYAVEITLNSCTELSGCTNVIVDGVEELEYNSLVISPNPAKNVLSIKSGQTLEKVMIYNISGMLIQTINENFESINVSELSSGIYIIAVKSRIGITHKQLIIE